jgi:sensor histidine kinase YesM
METGKSEKPPADIIKRNFQPVNKIFDKNNLHFADSIKSFWIKVHLANTLSSDTSIALIFPQNVSKAVLYKTEGDSLILIGKAGFFIAVLKRNISYAEYRIDMVLKANSKTIFLIQVLLYHGVWMPEMPVLENVAFAEQKALKLEMAVTRRGLLWDHFFTGIFFMFFVFGFIKYLVLGKDKAYLYYALLGLFSALMSLAKSEYPPLEIPWLENLRGTELFSFFSAVATLMQGLFILEILQLQIKYPRVALATKFLLFSGLLFASTYTIQFIASKEPMAFLYVINIIYAFLLLLMFFSWVWYLATIRKGFYKFIFLGALTIFTAYTIVIIIRFFNLYHLFPDWFGADQKGTNYFMQIALVIDMCFYFAGLAYRDRQVEKDKVLFEEKLKLQELESERAEAALRQQAVELEMQALRAQMNPHFIFNSLNSINRFILQNNKTQASEYLTKFSKLVRMILQNSQAPLITLESELESLQLYLELEAVRFDHHFEFKINVEDGLDVSGIMVPPLIIQPYTENAIWHGLMNKEEKGHLNIDIEQGNDELLLKITDDGIGRKQAAILAGKSTARHKSMGLKITADRIAMLQRLNRHESPVTINDLVHADGSAAGTEVVIKMPLMYENT